MEQTCVAYKGRRETEGDVNWTFSTKKSSCSSVSNIVIPSFDMCNTSKTKFSKQIKTDSDWLFSHVIRIPNPRGKAKRSGWIQKQNTQCNFG